MLTNDQSAESPDSAPAANTVDLDAAGLTELRRGEMPPKGFTSPSWHPWDGSVVDWGLSSVLELLVTRDAGVVWVRSETRR